MTRTQLQVIADKLDESAIIHREKAEEYVKNDAVWTARMAAMHLCFDLSIALKAAALATPEDPYDGK